MAVQLESIRSMEEVISAENSLYFQLEDVERSYRELSRVMEDVLEAESEAMLALQQTFQGELTRSHLSFYDQILPEMSGSNFRMQELFETDLARLRQEKNVVEEKIEKLHSIRIMLQEESKSNNRNQ